MRKSIVGVSLVAFVISLAWVLNKPGYDSASSVVIAFGALLASFVVKKDKQAVGQIQRVSGKSIAVQAGRDARIEDVRH